MGKNPGDECGTNKRVFDLSQQNEEGEGEK